MAPPAASALAPVHKLGAVDSNAYLDAFEDNDGGSPKLYSGECRVVREKLPPEVVQFCEARHGRCATRI